MKNLSKVFLGAMAILGMSMAAQAAVVTIPDSALTPSNYYYTDTIGGGIGSPLIMTGGGNAANVGASANDDGFSGPIALGFTLHFFGQDYTEFYANNNGNISFGNGISAFTPTGPQGASQPIISPFFADVDTRGAGSGLMYLRNDIANEIIITWDAVGYYSAQTNALDSFQLILRGPDYVVPVGEGNIGFFYKTMGWEQGQVSNVPAAVGFGDGLSNGEVLDGSTVAGISRIVNNEHIWFDPNLNPIPQTPEPATMMLFGTGLAGLVVIRRKMKS